MWKAAWPVGHHLCSKILTSKLSFCWFLLFFISWSETSLPFLYLFVYLTVVHFQTPWILSKNHTNLNKCFWKTGGLGPQWYRFYVAVSSAFRILIQTSKDLLVLLLFQTIVWRIILICNKSLDHSGCPAFWCLEFWLDFLFYFVSSPHAQVLTRVCLSSMHDQNLWNQKDRWKVKLWGLSYFLRSMWIVVLFRYNVTWWPDILQHGRL